MGRRIFKTHKKHKTHKTSNPETREIISQSTPAPTSQYGLFGGYVNLATKKSLRLYCSDCAVVSSSGHLIGSNAGREIDNHDCIIRMNLAPVTGFEADVGERTTVRVVGHVNFNKGLEREEVRNEILENKTKTEIIIISWMGTVEDVPKLTNEEYRFAFLLAHLYPDVQIYSSLSGRMKLTEELFVNATGITTKQAKTMLTTGWHTMVHAMEFCPNITVYGMAYGDFCRYTNESIPYHYYENKKQECDYFNKSEHNLLRGHLFITEKKIFHRWATTYKNIKFRHPRWPAKIQEDNETLHTPFLDLYRHNIVNSKTKQQKKRRKRRRKSKKKKNNLTV